MRAYQRIAIALICATAAYNSRLVAQQTAGGPATEQEDVLFFHQAVPPPGEGTVGMHLQNIGPMVSQAVTEAMSAVGPAVNEAVSAMTQAFTFVSAIGPGPAHTVIGAPFSGESTTEIVQTLADGNRITRKMSATLTRDSQGRTRRDQTLGAMGPFVTTGTAPNLSFITDPVAKVQYVLDHNAKTARQMPLPPGGGPGGMIIHGGMPPGPPLGPPMGGIGGPLVVPLPAPVNESLGKQTIEGVETDGSRSTITIAAGTIGNDLAIQIVSERWYSPALQEVILSTHSDPRMGKTTYRLTNISRNEPAHSVFEVPAGYTIVQPPIVSAAGLAECIAAGNTVTPGPPRQCTAADGKTYIEPPPAGVGPRPFNIPLPTR
ncbi:MAG: hypothetical protein HY651_05580 [Acidobacteria bacterium]|nr:hypothetical protein [Acidobacteriota bacterium]